MQKYKHTLIDRRVTIATETITSETSGTHWEPGIGLYVVSAIFRLVVYSSATDATDALDVTIQHSFNQDENPSAIRGWDEFVAFAQAAGNASDNFVALAQWSQSGFTPETESRTPNTTLAAGDVVQGPIFPDWRVVATITDGNDPIFSWKLDALFTVDS